MIYYPEALDDDLKLEIVTELKAGNADRKDQLILAHVRLALSIANRHIKRHNLSNLYDELNSAAVEGVIIAVDRILKGHLTHNDATPYIIKFIHHLINLCVSKQPIVPSPRNRNNTKSHSFLDVHAHHDNSGIAGIKETLDCIIRTRRERRIVDLRIKGYTDVQIGAIMGMPHQTIQRLRKILRKRFERLTQHD